MPWHLVLWKEDSLPMLTVPTWRKQLESFRDILGLEDLEHEYFVWDVSLNADLCLTLWQTRPGYEDGAVAL